jgi:hypothetical protein
MTPEDPRHGTTYGYRRYGCRCERCRRSNTRSQKVRRLRLVRGEAMTQPAIGARRRLLALGVIGWSVRDLAAQFGLQPRTVWQIRSGQREYIFADTHDRIVAGFDRLSVRPGPGDPRTSRLALAAGGVPPLCWDDDEIDDPAATPHVESSRSRRKVHVEDIEWLLQHNPLATAGQLGDRLHVTADAVAQACRRADRADLVARLARNARLLTDVIPGEVAS